MMDAQFNCPAVDAAQHWKLILFGFLFKWLISTSSSMCIKECNVFNFQVQILDIMPNLSVY